MPAAPSEPASIQVHGFAPLADAHARVLVLGSMPGAASLRLGQYYGHPRNAFWPIMGALFGFAPDAPYAERVDALKANRIAVWDVLAACEREGSLDADIDTSSIDVNDFVGFLRGLPHLRRVCCNGGKAWDLFRRRVAPQLDATQPLELVRLPSTSPAHAGMPRAEKLRLWRQGVADAGPQVPGAAQRNRPGT